MSKRNNRKVRYFGIFCNQKEFFGSTLDQDFFDWLPDLSWYHAKLILRHKDCSEDFRNKYANSSIWYERIVACLAKPARSKYFYKAASDSDTRVRRAALYGSVEEEVVTTLEAADWIVNGNFTEREDFNQSRKGMILYAKRFLKEYEIAMKSPAVGLLSPFESIRQMIKEKYK